MAEVKTSVVARPAEQFIVRAGYEWAFIFIDEISGTFSTVSSFGNFGYTWTHIGDQTLKQFLHEVEFDYFFGKVDYANKGRQFDFDQTILDMKRKQDDFDKENARDIWGRITSLEDVNDESAFYDNPYHESIITEELYGWDTSGIARQGRHPQCEGFWTRLWPLFLEATKPAPPDVCDCQTNPDSTGCSAFGCKIQ